MEPFHRLFRAARGGLRIAGHAKFIADHPDAKIALIN
jgi:hypothetical protein